jgi:hypothetical protein
VFFALRVIAFAVVFGRRAMGFGSILVVFGCLIVFVSSHCVSPACLMGTQQQAAGIAIGSGPSDRLQVGTK